MHLIVFMGSRPQPRAAPVASHLEIQRSEPLGGDDAEKTNLWPVAVQSLGGQGNKGGILPSGDVPLSGKCSVLCHLAVFATGAPKLGTPLVCSRFPRSGPSALGPCAFGQTRANKVLRAPAGRPLRRRAGLVGRPRCRFSRVN